MISIDSINHVSALLGADITAIQGTGGNISYKNGDNMAIKASGTRLVDALENNIFVTVSRSKILSSMNDRHKLMPKTTEKEDIRRPSIETPLHAVMPHKIVIHIHCVDTIAQTLSHNKLDALPSILKGIKWTLIPYARPGLPLAISVKKALKHSIPDAILLRNHGLVIGGNSIDEALERLRTVRERLKIFPRIDINEVAIDFLRSVNDINWQISTTRAWHQIATSADNFLVAKKGPFYPDHVVFLNGFIPIANSTERLSDAIKRYTSNAKSSSTPLFMIYEGKGVLVNPDITEDAKAMLDAFVLVCTRVDPNDKLISLHKKDIDELENWEAEKYRRTKTTLRARQCGK
jgi:rhamnose utilization protein RhaD (predicted bifunctional aldolase and dehydrogenase)